MLRLTWFTVIPRLHALYPDHLGTPRAALDLQRDAIVWRWELSGEAFGASAPNEDPDGDGQRLRLDLRFPGQRHDPATGLHENHHRDYDPSTGRYLQSDPIGIEGGINTYGYAEQNPMTYIDPMGLASCTYLVSNHTLFCASGEKTVVLGPKNVFSGRGQCMNDPNCSDQENVGPVPPGIYKMEYDPDKYGGSYRLSSSWLKEQVYHRFGLGRGGFFLHIGSISEGCITVRNEDTDTIQKWNEIKDIIKDQNDDILTVYP